MKKTLSALFLGTVLSTPAAARQLTHAAHIAPSDQTLECIEDLSAGIVLLSSSFLIKKRRKEEEPSAGYAQALLQLD